MGYGGATWDTAGTLTTGGGNTFDLADAEPSVDWPHNVGWWVFTVDPDGFGAVVTIDSSGSTTSDPGAEAYIEVFTGADEGSAEDYWSDYLSVTFEVTAGVTYHVRLATDADIDPISTYRLDFTLTPYVASPWIQRDDNHYIIAHPASTLMLDNVLPADQDGAGWWLSVLDGTYGGGPGRVGDYSAKKVLGGDDPWVGALDCVWQHARYGDQDEQYWNTSTTGITNDGPGVCRALPPPGDANVDTSSNVSYALTGGESVTGGGFGGATAHIRHEARAFWFLPVRDNLGPDVGLPEPYAGLGPVADGYPEGAVLEYESEYGDLLNVEITGDITDRDTFDDLEGVTFALHDLVAPSWIGPDDWSPWKYGQPGDPDTSGRERIEFTYQGGPPDWVDLPDVVTGDTGWEGLTTDYVDGPPDEAVIFGMALPFSGGGTPALDATRALDPNPALRFNLRPARYRWIYLDTTPTTVVRQWPRDDVRGVSSAPRLWPPSKSRRLAGGYPGGSNA